MKKQQGCCTEGFIWLLCGKQQDQWEGTGAAGMGTGQRSGAAAGHGNVPLDRRTGGHGATTSMGKGTGFLTPLPNLCLSHQTPSTPCPALLSGNATSAMESQAHYLQVRVAPEAHSRSPGCRLPLAPVPSHKLEPSSWYPIIQHHAFGRCCCRTSPGCCARPLRAQRRTCPCSSLLLRFER